MIVILLLMFGPDVLAAAGGASAFHRESDPAIVPDCRRQIDPSTVTE